MRRKSVHPAHLQCAGVSPQYPKREQHGPTRGPWRAVVHWAARPSGVKWCRPHRPSARRGGRTVPLASLGGGNVDAGGGGVVVCLTHGYGHMLWPQPFGPHFAATAVIAANITSKFFIFLLRGKRLLQSGLSGRREKPFVDLVLTVLTASELLL